MLLCRMKCVVRLCLCSWVGCMCGWLYGCVKLCVGLM